MDGLVLKHNERLSKVINNLKSHLIARDNTLATRNLPESEIDNNTSKEMESLNRKDSNEQLDLPDNEDSGGWRSQEDKSLSKSYLMWENNANLCWLDSSMSLLVHNKTLSHLVNDNSSQIAKIMKGYESAISIFNDYSNESTVEERLQKAKDLLQKVQETVLNYLKPILKCKEGEPDSAFCSLLNLISENKEIKNLFLVEFSWIRHCIQCAVPRSRNNKKTMITLSKVKAFNPSSPVSLCKCPFCESPDQEMEIKYKTLPQCLIFHFENGAGEGELDSLDFELNDRKYKLSGLITLEKSRDLTVNHFVTWVRDIATDSWLECNDLNSDILSFGVVPPLINLKDLYIVMYEALDEKGTISTISVGTDNTIRLDADDASSSVIPVINLSDEEEDTKFNQDNQTNKGASNTMVLGGLFKHDEIDYDSDEKMTKRLNDFLSDNTFESFETNSLEHFNSSCCKENNSASKKEKISTGNSVLGYLNSQDTASSISSEKTDDFLSKVDLSSNLLKTNLQSDSKKDTQNSAAINIKQSLVKDSIKTHMRVDDTLFISSNSEMASFVKPVLDNFVKTSKEIKDKPIIEKLPMLIDTKDIISGENIPPGLAENILAKDHTVSSNCLSATFENQDNKNADCPRKSLIELQNSKLDGNVLEDSSSLNMNSPSNAAGDCTQDAIESCARTSGLPISHKLKKKCVSKTDHAVKKFKTNEKEKFTEDVSVVYMGDPLASHDAEKTVETLTFPDLTVHTPGTEKKLQNCGIQLSTLPENVAAKTIKKNDIIILESKSVNTSETKTQNINTRLPVGMVGKKSSKDSFSEISKETEFTTVEHIHNSSNLQTTLNLIDEKSTVNLFEHKASTSISREMIVKHADNSVKEAVKSTIKQSKVNAKSLESAIPKVSESKNPTSSMCQTRIPNNKAVKQSEAGLACSAKPNEQSVKSQAIAEDVVLKKTVKQQMRVFEEKHTISSECELGVKSLPSKLPFVLLTRMKDSEIANYILGKIPFPEPNQTKSLEELTKTVVVKVERTDRKTIRKVTTKQAGPSKTSKVERIEPIRRSSRIFAQQMKKTEKASLEIMPKKSKNSHVQLENSISTKQNTTKRKHTMYKMLKTLPEVIENTLKTQDLPKRANRTHSVPEVDLVLSRDVHSQRNTKKKHLEDSCADEVAKSKRRRTKSIEAVNSDIQSCLPTALSLEATSSNQIVHESDDSSKVLRPSPNEYSPMLTSKNDPVNAHEIVVYTGDQIQICNGVSRSNSVHELLAKNAREDTEKWDKNKECTSACECNNLQLHELIENSSNCVFANVFQFFNLHKMGI